LEVTIVEAKELEAKDADGQSSTDKLTSTSRFTLIVILIFNLD